MSGPHRIRVIAAVAALALVAGACGVAGEDSTEPLEPAEARDQLDELADEIGWIDAPITRSASIPPPSGADLAATLPPLDEFPLRVESRDPGAVEIWSSTEKSGASGTTDAWMTEVAQAFNDAGISRADGSPATVNLRSIASGTGYQFIARGEELPQAFTPSNELWTEMAAEFQTMTEIRPVTVPNVAGIVMKNETADELRATYGELTPANLVDAVIAGDLVMGYTDPFASSTGLNFLLTVLDSIAEGDATQLTSPDVASVFEQFQRQVPFVALTTLQMRDSVENDNGTLDTFVMEWQTYSNTDSLQSGFEFIPFGVRHDSPLYGVGELTPAESETLELFAEFTEQPEFQDSAAEFGFDPEPFTPTVEVPSGSTLIDVQNVWKDKKDGGRPVATVFVVDVSG
ncbi:MAG TPA: substrate-binding domain-containing protein, partial [Ilumatobacteraceae bacterium]|nr:substrate-binding domain-containing protein [Ilumatobacteraceae bacterium]